MAPQPIPPSKKNSPGREFRDAVTNYFNREPSPVVIPSQTLEDVLLDWCLDHAADLQRSGIVNIRSHSTGLIVITSRECTLSNEKIVEMLMNDEKITIALNGSTLTVSQRRERQLLGLGAVSPLCVSCDALGTASLVYTGGCIVGLTCGHVIKNNLTECDKTRAYRVSSLFKDIETNKYRGDSPRSNLGYAWIHNTLDVAGIVTTKGLPCYVNIVEDIRTPVKFRKWWSDDEPLLNKVNYLQQSTVTKCGISSRKTTGHVRDVGYDCFYVEGCEVTPFAVPGDSGSLVLNETGEVLGVVRGIEFLQNLNIYITDVLPVW
eukprot:CAMPEP_0174817774 /NCGR_PEP_ID=MMETSP1107-20130205/299_1 /TAXON_ID=36770 /ORGANISM="Paraphysomonas vestita, Strain GFlagA" /LENGTH=318 /DNA_ID=CAMNT_0016028785 /DNA_START=318 /DNA_END=1271 /DNA_ORIENTATION=+